MSLTASSALEGSAIDEFALIRRYFESHATEKLARDGAGNALATDVALGIGDDCALLRPRAGCVAAVTTDTLVAGRHFPLETPPHAIGWKALAVSLSDLAAMAAEPQAFVLALTLPEVDANWLEAFAAGLFELAGACGIALVGGDTTRGPLTLNITAIGQVPERQALRRSGARIGDVICVTGTLGDAALALQRLKLNRVDSASAHDAFGHDALTTRDAESAVKDALSADAWLQRRLDYPTPRLKAGVLLRDIARAAIDLSDGLAGDLGHILVASGVGAEIDADALPMSSAFAQLHDAGERLRLQAAGGDDYELCICLPPAQLERAQALLKSDADIVLTSIGRIVAGRGITWLDSQIRQLDFKLGGYDHFRS